MTNRLHGAVYSESFIIPVPNAIEIDEKNVEIAYIVLNQSAQCAQTASFKHFQSIAISTQAVLAVRVQNQ